ncbi:MAG: hypothetical protein Q9218_001408 [Villophora microphyllina]
MKRSLSATTAEETQVLGENGLNKGCPCFQYSEDSAPYQPFTDQELQDQQTILAELAELKDDGSSPNKTTDHAKGTLTCSANSVAAIPPKFKETTGDVMPNQLLYTLRQVICTNTCDKPADLPNGVSASTGSKTTGDCEVSVTIVGGIEAYMYRGTPSTDDQWQECWDSTQQIIEECVKEGPNTGWVNGPNPYQFYQGGFRPLNDAGAIHRPMTGKGLQASVTKGTVGPNNKNGFTCGSGEGGARIADCLGILGSIVNGKSLDASDTRTTFCTSDSTCLQAGQTGSSDGKNIYSSYCEVAASGSCAFVAASKTSSLGGFPGKSCFSPSDIANFVRLGANKCGANQAQGVWAAGFQGGDEVAGTPYTAFGLVDAEQPGVLFVP